MPEKHSPRESEASLEAGVLYVVATPIGNLGDITRRAADVLGNVEIIAAEDTRRTLSLLSALSLSRPKMVALHEHNEAAASDGVVRSLLGGATVALASDAGTPLLSDPGFTLVKKCFEAGISVLPVPGPSSIIAALSVCPLPVSGSRFVGFLPAKTGARRASLTGLLESGGPVVFFEAPHRLRDCLMDLHELAPERRIFVAREMTKRFETYLVNTPEALIAHMDAGDQWRGEVVCVLEAQGQDVSPGSEEQRRVMRILAAELPPTQAARIGAQLLGMKKKELYALAAAKQSEENPEH